MHRHAVRFGVKGREQRGFLDLQNGNSQSLDIRVVGQNILRRSALAHSWMLQSKFKEHGGYRAPTLASNCMTNRPTDRTLQDGAELWTEVRKNALGQTLSGFDGQTHTSYAIVQFYGLTQLYSLCLVQSWRI